MPVVTKVGHLHHCTHNATSTRNMVVIGLLDIPPELHLQIAKFAETGQSLKALSVTSRSLRGIAQSVLFRKLQIHLGRKLMGSIDDLLANPRICAAIRFLELHGRHCWRWKPPPNDGEKLSIITKLLPRMVGLKRVLIFNVEVNEVFINAFLEIAAKIPLRLDLSWNAYPLDISLTANTRLRISDLRFDCGAAAQPSIEFYQLLLRVSATTLTKLDVTVEGDGLIKLADIDLPFLHEVSLDIQTDDEATKASSSAFITAHRTIRKFSLTGTHRLMLVLPPNALPGLRELHAPTELVNQLVPGRPVEAINVRSRSEQQWLGEEVGRSTVRVRKLHALLKTAISDTRMVRRMVTILPSLESVTFAVANDVSSPFAQPPLLILLQTVLKVIEVLTSLKCLTHLHFELFHREIWVNHDFNGLATKLRKANSCFSCIEIWERSANRREHTISVWNEVIGVFHHIEYVSEL